MVARAGKERASPASPGEVAGHPVGEDQAPRYDPRQARKLRSLSVDELLGAGKQQLEAGFFERARRSFQAAIVKTPSRVEAYNGVGVTFYARGDLDEALAWYKRALQVDPAFGDAYYNLGCVYALQGKKELAFRYLRLAALNHYAELAQLQADPDLASLRDAVEMRELEGLMTAEAR